MAYKPDLTEYFKAQADAAILLQREFARVAVEFAAVVSAIPKPDVLWRWDANALEPFNAQSAALNRVVFTQAGGRSAVRLSTMPGDTGIAGSGSWERCDLQLSQELSDGYEGHEAWWAHSIWFPNDYVDPLPSPLNAQPWNGGVVFDFHNTTQGSGQANFMVKAMPVTATSPDRPTGLSFQLCHGDQNKPTEANYPIGPVQRGVWYEFKYHVRWTAGATGYFDAWVNGVQKMAYRGPTLYPGQGVYAKLARYGSPTGKPCAVLHGPVTRARTEAALA